MIIFFEVLGTTLFAYGIISSQGSDFMVSAALFGGIFISSKFSGGHVIIILICVVESSCLFLLLRLKQNK